MAPGGEVQSLGIPITRPERPLPYARELFDPLVVEQGRGGTGGMLQPRCTEVVPATLQYGHRPLRPRHRACDREIVLEELLLEVLRVRGDDGLASTAKSPTGARGRGSRAICQPRRGLNDQVTPRLESFGDRAGHRSLLGAYLESFPVRKSAFRRENGRYRISDVVYHAGVVVNPAGQSGIRILPRLRWPRKRGLASIGSYPAVSLENPGPCGIAYRKWVVGSLLTGAPVHVAGS